MCSILSFLVCFADFAFSNCKFTTSYDFGDQQCLVSHYNRAQNNGRRYALVEAVFTGRECVAVQKSTEAK